MNMLCQIKRNVAKKLKKFENEGYIKREVNPENRRKYMLNVTEKGKMLAPKYRQFAKDWENEVGITDEDDLLKERLKEIAIKGMKIIENK